MSAAAQEGRWSPEELERIGGAEELRIAPVGREGSRASR